MCASRGFEMTSKQLNELWQFDLKLAHELLNLPLRTCTENPSSWGKHMEEPKFQELKIKIRKMWCYAALHFSVFKASGDAGWGLKVAEDHGRDLSISDKSSFTYLGWIAEAPNESECLTAHRYYRSLVDSKNYLGGPISLANWGKGKDCSVKVTCADASFKGKGFYYISTKKPLHPGTEIVWDYGQPGVDLYPSLANDICNWQLNGCCSQMEALPTSSIPSPSTKPAGKHKAEAITAPRKKMRVAKSFRYCPYCGLNLEDMTDSNKNMQCHIATKHTIDVCHEAELETNEVDPIKFLSHLYTVSTVRSAIQSHGYSIKPACHFFCNSKCEPLPKNPSIEDQQNIFRDFEAEAKFAFRNYKIVYLKGITVPVQYQDLLPSGISNYENVKWKIKKPASNLFSVKKKLTAHEQEMLQWVIDANFHSIVMTYEHWTSQH